MILWRVAIGLGGCLNEVCHVAPPMIGQRKVTVSRHEPLRTGSWRELFRLFHDMNYLELVHNVKYLEPVHDVNYFV